jgi:mannose-6-phosphate isomerase
MSTSERPWGTYTILDETPLSKTKTITVKPGHRLSYQTHEKRSEYWVIVDGSGVITLDGEQMDCLAGDAFVVPVGTAHRIANTGDIDLVFIEVQLGLYFGEDDIVRIEDDYSRE